MKKYNIIIMSFLFVVVFTSCEKKLTTKDLTTVKDAPVVELIGDAEIVLAPGTEFVDPGVKATTKDGQSLNFNIWSVKGIYSGYMNKVNIEYPDLYEIEYQAQLDGVITSALREVWVNPEGTFSADNLQGLYLSTVTRGGNPAYDDLHYVLITKQTDSTFYVTDAVGGYYDRGRGYGPNYAAGFTITFSVTGGYLLSKARFISWDDEVEVGGFSVDPVNKQIVWTASTFSSFGVTLTKVE